MSTAPNYDFITYRQMVHEVTQTFNSLSQRIIEIQNELSKRESMTRLAVCIGNIQALEQTKLEQVKSLCVSRCTVLVIILHLSDIDIILM